MAAMMSFRLQISLLINKFFMLLITLFIHLLAYYGCLNATFVLDGVWTKTDNVYCYWHLTTILAPARMLWAQIYMDLRKAIWTLRELR